MQMRKGLAFGKEISTQSVSMFDASLAVYGLSKIQYNASPSFILCFRSVLSNEIETLKFKLLIRN